MSFLTQTRRPFTGAFSFKAGSPPLCRSFFFQDPCATHPLGHQFHSAVSPKGSKHSRHRWSACVKFSVAELAWASYTFGLRLVFSPRSLSSRASWSCKCSSMAPMARAAAKKNKRRSRRGMGERPLGQLHIHAVTWQDQRQQETAQATKVIEKGRPFGECYTYM